MTAIPISPSLIANAGIFTVTGNAFPINVWDKPPEGTKAISMQFTFDTKPGWYVNFQNTPNPPLSRLCSLYVDATNSTSDVTIYFPDSGYSCRVNSLGSRMIPVITNATQNVLPQFYVLLDSSGRLTTDVVNVIALNTMMPDFQANELDPVLSYGYSSAFVPQPLFTQSQVFYNPLTLSAGTASQTTLIMNGTLWYVTAIIVNGIIQTSGVSTTVNPLTIKFDDAASTSFQKTIYYEEAANTYIYDNIYNISGLQWLSLGKGPLNITLSSPNTANRNCNLDVTVMGGILTP